MIGQFLYSLTHMSLLARFALVMAVILLVPMICKRVRLPAVVGFLLAGIIFGPNGFRVSQEHAPVAHFLSEVGKLLLMFFAGLEIDLDQFKRTGSRSVVFGTLTFSIPFIAGGVVSLLSGYGVLSALLVGSLLASHTLIGFPIIMEKKMTDNEAVGVTVGATMFTDIAALLVLAVCVPIHTSGFSTRTFVLQLLGLAVFVPVILIGLTTLGQRLLKQWGDSKANQVLLMFVIIALAGIGAEIIHLEAIVGAFLAGLAVNRAVRHSTAKEEIEFMGDTLFVPMFFITIGFLIDVPVFCRTIATHIWMVIGIVGGLILSKLLAAMATRRIYGYTRDEGFVMWSLSLPQVAATLAAAIVAFQAKNSAGAGLIDQTMVNTVIVMMLVTSVLGPVLTERYCSKITRLGKHNEQDN